MGVSIHYGSPKMKGAIVKVFLHLLVPEDSDRIVLTDVDVLRLRELRDLIKEYDLLELEVASGGEWVSPDEVTKALEGPEPAVVDEELDGYDDDDFLLPDNIAEPVYLDARLKVGLNGWFWLDVKVDGEWCSTTAMSIGKIEEAAGAV